MAGPDDSVPPPPPRGGPPGAQGDERPEMQRALGDLEGAMRRLAGSAQREWSDRAVEAIDEATGRLRRLERRRDRRAERHERRAARHRHGRGADDGHGMPGPDDAEGGPYGSRRRHRPRRLYRVPHEGVIAGVCAGLARRMGLETWVVRCFAVTGLVFMPQIVFIAYWVLCFTMRRVSPAEADAVFAVPGGSAGRVPIAGYDRGVSPRDRLRAVRESFDANERRLRRMEGYVTSSRYELDRELQKIDG
jgi:phage shock protein C